MNTETQEALEQERDEMVVTLREDARHALTEVRSSLDSLNRLRREAERLYDVELVEGRAVVIVTAAMAQAEVAMAAIDSVLMRAEA